MQTVAEFMEHPAVRHHDLVHEYEHPEVGRLRMMGQPLVFDDTPTRDPGPPPTLGQHTGEILTELGYSDAAIADLRRRHVLGGPAHEHSAARQALQQRLHCRQAQLRGLPGRVDDFGHALA